MLVVGIKSSENNYSKSYTQYSEKKSSSSSGASWTPPEPVPPKVIIVDFTPVGELQLAFDQIMIIPELSKYILQTRNEYQATDFRKLTKLGNELGIEVDLS